MKTKILCIGDSVDLPREETRYEDTWYYLLKEKYSHCDFICYFTRGLLMPATEQLFNSYYQYYNPDIVIWESGITDSAPRYILEKKLRWQICLRLAKAIRLEKQLWKLIKKTHTRNPKRTDTPIEKFEKYAEILINNFVNIGVKKIILLKVEPIASSVQKKNPFWMDNIAKYNQVYEKLSQKYHEYVILIAPKAKATDDCFIADGYHPNSKGMKMTFDGIDAVLKDLL